MKIVSTNIGKPRIIEWNGITVQTGIYKFQVYNPIFLGTDDVEKDHVIDRKHHGGRDKACYLYSSKHYHYWQKLYPDLEMPWGIFGENITVDDLDEENINIGDIFKIGNAIVQATQPRQPCYKLGIRFGNQNVVKQFIESGLAGVYVRVLQNGNVKTENEIKCIEKKESLSIRKVFELIYTNNFEEENENAKKAIHDPFLAESCRRDLIKRWEKYI